MFQHCGPPIAVPEAPQGEDRVFIQWYFQDTMAKGQQEDWKNNNHSPPNLSHSGALDGHKHPCDPLPLCPWLEPKPSNARPSTEKHEVSLLYLFDFQWAREYKFSLLQEDRCSDSCPWRELHLTIWHVRMRSEWSEINVRLFGVNKISKQRFTDSVSTII